jgi:Ca2+-transporting ATPase
MLAGVLGVYAWALYSGRAEGETRAIAFAAIVFANLALLFVTRSREQSVFAMVRERNPPLWWITLGAIAALLAALYWPPAAEIFRFRPIGAGELGLAAAAGALGVAWYELRKNVLSSGR